MNNAEIDRILASQDDIVPSSGFAASVMDAVRREAAAPPPIPFPWKRAWPMLVLAGLSIVLLVGMGAVTFAQPSSGSIDMPPIASMLAAAAGSAPAAALGLTALSLLAAFVAVRVSLGLTGARG